MKKLLSRVHHAVVSTASDHKPKSGPPQHSDFLEMASSGHSPKLERENYTQAYASITLDMMPKEVLFQIFSYLSAVELCRAGQTCKQFQEVAVDEHLWKSLYLHAKEHHYLEKEPSKRKRHKGYEGLETENSFNWRNKYKETFRLHPKKGNKIINNPNEISLQLNSNHVEIGDEADELHYLEGEVTVYVHSESLVTNGVYVIFYGEESWRALETKRNGYRRVKQPIVCCYFHVLGSHEWEDRKKQKITLARGTYRYPFKFPVPKIGLTGQRLPASFYRASKKSQGFFKIHYSAAAIIAQHFPYSNIGSPRTKLFANESRATQQRSLQVIKHNWGHRVTERIKKGFLLHSGGASFEARLERSWYNLGEDMKLTLAVNNTKSRKKVHSVSVGILEVIGENMFCKEVIKRGAGDRHGHELSFPLDVGPFENKPEVELVYPIRYEHLQGSSLFNAASFSQSYLLVITFNMSLGIINPRIVIPLIITNLNIL